MAAAAAPTLATTVLLVVLVCLTSLVQQGLPARSYYGNLIGKFTKYAHGINGAVYVVDDKTLFVQGFAYDGTAPDAYFWVGNTTRPTPEGYIVPYPEDFKGRDPPVLPPFTNADIILHLPFGKRIKDIKWLAVWCRRFTVNFGEIFIPSDLKVPTSRVLPQFKRLAHGLRSGNITILDAKTFYIPNLHYDGAGPDAYFWVGNGSEPNPLGIKVPNERGSLEPLRGYQGEDIEIQLPGNHTVYDIDWLAVWCVQYRHNFGHVMIPKDLDVPPALGQTKITTTSSTSTTPDPLTTHRMTNCRELLPDKLQVQWDLQGESVVIRLSGRIKDDQYMAFGLSGDAGRSTMIGADVVVAFFDKPETTYRAVDYYISAKAQCDGKSGVCPDERIGGRDDVQVLYGEQRDGITSITFKRPLQTNDGNRDRLIPSDSEVNVIAAIGLLNNRKEANAHSSTEYTMDEIRIDFSSRNDHACLVSLVDRPDEVQLKPWPIVKIKSGNTFSVRIGPTGGKRGYTAITGHPSWGIAWYVNEKLIPEIYVERGQTYTFIVEGGNDTSNAARYHPFYITDSKEGGFAQKRVREQKNQRVYAGVGYDTSQYPYPTAAGRYCEYAHTTIDRSSEFESFDNFFKTLELRCEDGDPAYLNWTVAKETPDLLYYQCYTHNNLGWKIHVVDPGYLPLENSATFITTRLEIVSSFVTLLLLFGR